MMRSLSVQLLTMLTIALLPLGLIAVYQTLKVVNEVESIAERDILARTAQAAQDELGLIRRAQGVAYALGSAAASTSENPELCDATMRNFVNQEDEFVFAGFLQLNGTLSCSSTDETIDFSTSPAWHDFVGRPRPMVTFNSEGATSRQSVITAIVPMYSLSGELLGAGAVSIPHRLSRELLEPSIQSLELAIINQRGEVLSTSPGNDQVQMFQRLALEPGTMEIHEDGLTYRIEDQDAQLAIALVPLIDGESYIVGRWTDSSSAFAVSLLGTATPAFPVIMWLTSLFVAFFAIDRLVLQYLKKMRKRMAAFSADDLQGSQINLRNAPREVDEIAACYNHMIDQIAQDHSDLERNVREKELLLKEVHHRVRNNLQLIASILNMQLRQIDSPEANAVLRRVQDRVMSLATIHKSLYTDTNVKTVQVDELLTEIIDGTLDVGLNPDLNISPEVNLAPIQLDPDQAIPLSLLLTEATTNALKYMGPSENEDPILRIELSEPNPKEVALKVENSRGNNEIQTPEGTGLGKRLIEAFVQQLGGELDIAETPDSYTIRVRFKKLVKKTPLSEAA
ncbi:sensor histidine kinase [Rhodobacteraceae bacterium]|nr:sensor histidine kinase [Paracoccaceae bacterium]